MEKSAYKHTQLPTVKPGKNEENVRVNKSPPDWYTQQPAYNFTNPTNQKEVYNIKPIHNHKYHTISRTNLDTQTR